MGWPRPDKKHWLELGGYIECLLIESLKLASCLKLPHHEGVGGVEDFVSTKEYEKHIKKNKKWSSKRKEKSIS